MKNYVVWYWIKANRQEVLLNMLVSAENSKAACAKCKLLVKEKTGRNAFRPTTKKPEVHQHG